MIFTPELNQADRIVEQSLFRLQMIELANAVFSGWNRRKSFVFRFFKKSVQAVCSFLLTLLFKNTFCCFQIAKSNLSIAKSNFFIVNLKQNMRVEVM